MRNPSEVADFLSSMAEESKRDEEAEYDSTTSLPEKVPSVEPGATLEEEEEREQGLLTKKAEDMKQGYQDVSVLP